MNIQDIRYPDEAFDIVIANHMLYHVPDLSKALSEVKRVLKTGGIFYSATNGNGGMRTFLRNALKVSICGTKAFSQNLSFSLENGKEILSEYFSDVRKLEYEDSLAVTITQDLLDWMISTISISSYSEKDIKELYSYLEEIRKRDGAINISKECGLFISVK